ncbi:CPBP family intramembrane glutamic endopeptidase [Thermoactinomyces sp. DSM 45892]|uniref:CPBP family intramembrane glutamic endopeptidase n=1 Tax=Thermoactinomyces sp. DSM 45892 TaxID=1882753 RepID=UPI0008993ADA|nr:type II CAAX endopeptidase family protein [Thermoactinomyces sp. DSM 45892]SDX97665.1 CAAX protease self-immunity [Thermoactinomyces sp. DSM 45892]
MNTKQTNQLTFYRKWGQAVSLIHFLIIAIAIGWLMWNGLTDIRYSSDHQSTKPIWNIWIPALIGIMLIKMMSLHLPVTNFHQVSHLPKSQLTIQSIIFLSGAVLFPTTLLLVDGNNPHFSIWYIGLKLTFLLMLPWIIIFIYRFPSQHDTIAKQPQSLSQWARMAPFFIGGVWIYLSYFSIFSTPHTPSTVTDPLTLFLLVLSSFFVNSLLEEWFYRVWLQTHLERLLGTWPAIWITSVLWSIWHIAIQGTGEWSTDIATVISNQGITGVFLGYLWSRYRNIWILILIHGIINAPPYLLLDIWRNWF